MNKIDENIVGKIMYYNSSDALFQNARNNNVQHQLDDSANEACILPNNQILFTHQESGYIKVYDKNFRVIKTVESIQNDYTDAYGVAINDDNQLYFSYRSKDSYFN